MPLPESHRESLERHLSIHDQQLEALHTSQQAFTREIERRETADPGRAPDEGREPNAKAGGIPALMSQRQVIERKIRIHEALAALGRDQRSNDSLGELIGNPDLAREAARDPKAFAKERGIEIPANMAVEIDVDEDQIRFRVAYYDELAPFLLTWNVDGLSPPQLDPRQAGEPIADPEARTEDA
jgi:hypothetical protein